MRWVTFLAWGMALLCGFGAFVLLVVVAVMTFSSERSEVKPKKDPTDSDEDLPRRPQVGVAPAPPRRPAPAPAKRPEAPKRPITARLRDPNAQRREQELKRDTLHLLRRLQATEKEERAQLCGDAVKLFDSIEQRVGSGLANVTAGRIVFCNALMECGGLDALRDWQESKEPNAVALVERIVPVIFST